MAGMKDATVRQLQIFEAAARALSFSAAAQALHLTQPAVSMQMRQLEHLAAVPLFERVGRRLQLTDAGEELLVHARAVLRALEDADEAFASMKGLRGGRVRDPSRPGRLRLLYEASPMAFIVEQAGGLATTGRQRLLEVQPRALHQRVPVILGSRKEVERLGQYHLDHDRGDEVPYTNPLFNLRSLLRDG